MHPLAAQVASTCHAPRACVCVCFCAQENWIPFSTLTRRVHAHILPCTTFRSLTVKNKDLIFGFWRASAKFHAHQLSTAPPLSISIRPHAGNVSRSPSTIWLTPSSSVIQVLTSQSTIVWAVARLRNDCIYKLSPSSADLVVVRTQQHSYHTSCSWGHNKNQRPTDPHAPLTQLDRRNGKT